MFEGPFRRSVPAVARQYLIDLEAREALGCMLEVRGASASEALSVAARELSTSPEPFPLPLFVRIGVGDDDELSKGIATALRLLLDHGLEPALLGAVVKAGSGHALRRTCKRLEARDMPFIVEGDPTDLEGWLDSTMNPLAISTSVRPREGVVARGRLAAAARLARLRGIHLIASSITTADDLTSASLGGAAWAMGPALGSWSSRPAPSPMRRALLAFTRKCARGEVRDLVDLGEALATVEALREGMSEDPSARTLLAKADQIGRELDGARCLVVSSARRMRKARRAVGETDSELQRFFAALASGVRVEDDLDRLSRADAAARASFALAEDELEAAHASAALVRATSAFRLATVERAADELRDRRRASFKKSMRAWSLGARWERLG